MSTLTAANNTRLAVKQPKDFKGSQHRRVRWFSSQNFKVKRQCTYSMMFSQQSNLQGTETTPSLMQTPSMLVDGVLAWKRYSEWVSRSASGQNSKAYRQCTVRCSAGSQNPKVHRQCTVWRSAGSRNSKVNRNGAHFSSQSFKEQKRCRYNAQFNV